MVEVGNVGREDNEEKKSVVCWHVSENSRGHLNRQARIYRLDRIIILLVIAKLVSQKAVHVVGDENKISRIILSRDHPFSLVNGIYKIPSKNLA